MRLRDLLARLRARWAAATDVVLLYRENRRLSAMLASDAEVIADLARDLQRTQVERETAVEHVARLRIDREGLQARLRARDEMLNELEARLASVGVPA